MLSITSKWTIPTTKFNFFQYQLNQNILYCIQERCACLSQWVSIYRITGNCGNSYKSYESQLCVQIFYLIHFCENQVVSSVILNMTLVIFTIQSHTKACVSVGMQVYAWVGGQGGSETFLDVLPQKCMLILYHDSTMETREGDSKMFSFIWGEPQTFSTHLREGHTFNITEHFTPAPP